MELKIILAHVIKNFKITSLDQREEVFVCWEILLTAAKPLRICFTPRQNIPDQVLCGKGEYGP